MPLLLLWEERDFACNESQMEMAITTESVLSLTGCNFSHVTKNELLPMR